MRTLLAVLMLAASFQVVQADDRDEHSSSSGSGSGGATCITSTEGQTVCL